MIIVGVDEAGRGCLAGNVVAAAVILPDGFMLNGLTDSKKLTPTKREILYQKIIKYCCYAVGQASPYQIDNINILQATMLAMKQAINGLNVKYNKVLVDGNCCPDVLNCEAIIKGDLMQPVISAASIVAKVVRDKQMMALHQQYPKYGFDKHKSYGTKAHLEAIQTYGVIMDIHRQSFKPVREKNNLMKI